MINLQKSNIFVFKKEGNYLNIKFKIKITTKDEFWTILVAQDIFIKISNLVIIINIIIFI